MEWRARLKELPEKLVSGLYALSAVIIIKIFVDVGVIPILRVVTDTMHEPSAQPHATLILPKILKPSLFLGLAALAVLAGRDGLRRTIRCFFMPETVAGAAFYWILINRLVSALMMAFFISLFNSMAAQSHRWPAYPAIMTVSLIIVPAYLAGWFISRRSSFAALPGILVGIAAGVVLWLPDFILGWWQWSSTASWQPLHYLQTTVPMIISTLLSIPFAVAPVLLRNLRGGRIRYGPAD
jgi:hypothetical protein